MTAMIPVSAVGDRSASNTKSRATPRMAFHLVLVSLPAATYAPGWCIRESPRAHTTRPSSTTQRIRKSGPTRLNTRPAYVVAGGRRLPLLEEVGDVGGPF